MDKLALLQQRRAKVLDAGTEIRKQIASLVDEESFVELSGFSYSKSDFYNADAEGEGVVTGFATIEGYPVYIAAQNFAVLHGGMSTASCAKILRCLKLAEKNATPIVYILHSLGVQVGEGVTVLEGMASLLAESAKLHGVVPQFTVISGEVYGQSTLLAACSDFVFFLKEGVLAPDSPLVIAAKSGLNIPKEQVGGAAALSGTNVVSFTASGMQDVHKTISKILDCIPAFSASVVETGVNLNAAFPELDKSCKADALIRAVFDPGTLVEFDKICCPEVRCCIGRAGGIGIAAVVFDGEDGVELNAQNIEKVTSLVQFASYYDVPFVSFVNTTGIRADLATNNSLVLRSIFRLIESYSIHDNAKISIVYKQAVGIGYTLFAAKSIGFDYVYAFANAKIALFTDVKGAQIEFSEEKDADREGLAARYAEENADPIHAAKGGYVDNIIDPACVKQYLVASLQMLLK